mmetsp:Transcript_96913/g.277138  ORF Transcript_96913/g.277138 Transcript_96913/m.277138 type:complete len:225 (-) Transcript_96913:1659-2333(-)
MRERSGKGRGANEDAFRRLSETIPSSLKPNNIFLPCGPDELLVQGWQYPFDHSAALEHHGESGRALGIDLHHHAPVSEGQILRSGSSHCNRGTRGPNTRSAGEAGRTKSATQRISRGARGAQYGANCLVQLSHLHGGGRWLKSGHSPGFTLSVGRRYKGGRRLRSERNRKLVEQIRCLGVRHLALGVGPISLEQLTLSVERSGGREGRARAPIPQAPGESDRVG